MTWAKSRKNKVWNFSLSKNGIPKRLFLPFFTPCVFQAVRQERQRRGGHHITSQAGGHAEPVAQQRAATVGVRGLLRGPGARRDAWVRFISFWRSTNIFRRGAVIKIIVYRLNQFIINSYTIRKKTKIVLKFTIFFILNADDCSPCKTITGHLFQTWNSCVLVDFVLMLSLLLLYYYIFVLRNSTARLNACSTDVHRLLIIMQRSPSTNFNASLFFNSPFLVFLY